MIQSKLVKYIKELSTKDRERFSQFVHSPYFNQHLKTQQLLELILEGLEKPPAFLERQNIFRRLFPKEAYNEQQLHNVMSYLKKLYHKFLAYEHFENRTFLESLYTLEIAFKKTQFDVLKNRGKILKKRLDKQVHRDSEYYYSNYRLNNLLGFYTTQLEDRSKSHHFTRMLDNLDKFYIREKLITSCHLTANMMMMNTRYEFRFLEELLAHISENWEEYQSDISIIMYYTILMSIREEDKPEHYLRLKEILANHFDILPEDEGRDLYAFTYNYCIHKINRNRGENHYQMELFELYKQGVKNGILLENGMIGEFDYKNITTLGCTLKEFEWTERFIYEYKENLHISKRENAFNFNLAYLYYTKKMYHEALSALLLVQFTDVKYHLNTYFLLLRTYYALKDTEALLSLIETFRIYVMRNRKMTTDQKRGYTNFLRFAKKLVLLKHHGGTYSRNVLGEKLGDLNTKIENTENVINRYWLVEECMV